MKYLYVKVTLWTKWHASSHQAIIDMKLMSVLLPVNLKNSQHV